MFFSRLFGVGATDVARLGQRQGHARQRDALRAAAGDRRSLDDGRYPADGAWTDDDVYDGYDAAGAPILPAGVGDAYVRRSADGAGTGFTVADMAGVEHRPHG